METSLQITSASLFKERDFSLLLAGQFISALGVWVYKLTGSPLEVGKMAIAALLPYLLFGLVAGVYVDRWDKKKTMIVSDLLRAAMVALIPLVIFHSINFVYALTFLITSVSLFFNPAKMSVVPSLFPQERILSATSLAEAVESVTEILGYAVAGVLVALISLPNIFVLDALTFLCSALAISGMKFRHQQQNENAERAHVLRDIKEGLDLIRDTRALSFILGLYCLVLLVFSGFNPLVFVYALKSLGVTSVQLGILEAMHAVGITLGGLSLSFLGSRVNKGKVIFGGFLISGLAIAVLGLYPWYPLALVAFFFTGLSNAMFLIPIQVLFQEITPASMYGRVFSARFAVTRIAFMSSVWLLTYFAALAGVEKVYLGVGLLLVVIAMLAKRRLLQTVQ